MYSTTALMIGDEHQMNGLIYVLIGIVVLFAIIATIVIGNSSENRKENTAYDKKTSKNLIRLTAIYVIAVVLIVLLFIWMT
jgi:L-asparagine transporter-like permease